MSLLHLVTPFSDATSSLVLRPNLIRRLLRFEKSLKIPEASRSKFEGELRKPAEITVNAIRLWRRSDAITLDANGKIVKKGKENKKETPTPGPSLTAYFVPATPRREVEQDVAPTPDTKSTVRCLGYGTVVVLISRASSDAHRGC